jgi:hypothetical protein
LQVPARKCQPGLSRLKSTCGQFQLRPAVLLAQNCATPAHGDFAFGEDICTSEIFRVLAG